MFDYLIQLSPLILGVLFFIAIRYAKLLENKVVVRHSERLGTFGNISMPSTSGKKSDDKYRDEFERRAYDMLVENGLMPSGARHKNVSKLAFERLGIADIKELPHLARRLETDSISKLTLFVPGQKELLSMLLSFKNPSGILLSYLSEYKLDDVGVWSEP